MVFDALDETLRWTRIKEYKESFFEYYAVIILVGALSNPIKPDGLYDHPWYRKKQGFKCQASSHDKNSKDEKMRKAGMEIRLGKEVKEWNVKWSASIAVRQAKSRMKHADIVNTVAEPGEARTSEYSHKKVGRKITTPRKMR